MSLYLHKPFKSFLSMEKIKFAHATQKCAKCGRLIVNREPYVGRNYNHEPGWVCLHCTDVHTGLPDNSVLRPMSRPGFCTVCGEPIPVRHAYVRTPMGKACPACAAMHIHFGVSDKESLRAVVEARYRWSERDVPIREAARRVLDDIESIL